MKIQYGDRVCIRSSGATGSVIQLRQNYLNGTKWAFIQLDNGNRRILPTDTLRPIRVLSATEKAVQARLDAYYRGERKAP